MKKAITIVLAVMLIFTFASTASAQITKDQYYARSTLSGDELEAYDYFYNQLSNGSKDWYKNFGLNRERIHQISQYVYYDSPELLGGYTGFTETDIDRINQKASEILEPITTDMTDYEKVKTLYYGLAENTKYGISEEAGDEGQTIVGALVYGEAVCGGLTATLQYLLYQIDIPCYTVVGGSHAWNIIQIDGQWYNADITGDQEIIKYGISELKGFLWNDKDFYASHEGPDEDMNPTLPECPENYEEPTPEPTPTPTATPTATPAPAVANVEPQEPTGGGGNYTGWIILAVAAAGAALAAGLRRRQKKRI